MSAIKFRSEYFCNSEWASTPHEVEVYLEAGWQQKIEQMVRMLNEVDATFIATWCAANYEFFDEDGSVFEPDYSTGGCNLQVWRHGTFNFQLPFKYSDGEEGWTDDFRWADGVLMEEAA